MWYARKDITGNMQSWIEHATNVSITCEQYGAKIGMADAAKYMGYMHDIGKTSTVWQQYLTNAQVPGLKEDHSTAAWQASPNHPVYGYGFCGHHGGLSETRADLDRRRRKIINKYDATLCIPAPALTDEYGMREYLRIKMLHSILVDADVTDARKFEGRYDIPKQDLNTIKLAAQLDATINGFNPDNRLTGLRTDIYNTCKAAGQNTSNKFFTLTVPTGGGKTLSSMAFALQNAAATKKEKIIYVIPFTSIIEQVAGQYRKVFGPRVVMEYHSNFMKQNEDSLSPAQDPNWASPIIVTTVVQFLDSIFGTNNHSARKVHNIANSVIIFDEAQKLPYQTRKVVMLMLRELCNTYNCTVVFCTATQPDLTYIKETEKVVEIIPAKLKLVMYKNLKRATIYKKVTEYRDAASLVANIKKVKSSIMVIVNTRQAAFDVASLIPEAVHLSAAMYPAHRRQVLKETIAKLKSGERVVCITTQLIEAGVDIDFPVVWRQEDSLDSIVQAAGRCNREGLLPRCGSVRIFKFSSNQYTFSGDNRAIKTNLTRDIFKYNSGDLLGVAPMLKYMTRLSAKCNSSTAFDLIDGIRWFNFPEIASEMKVINQPQMQIFVVTTDQAKYLFTKVQECGIHNIPIPGWLLRKCAQYMVSVYPNRKEELIGYGVLEASPHPELDVYVVRESGYSIRYGLCPVVPGNAFSIV